MFATSLTRLVSKCGGFACVCKTMHAEIGPHQSYPPFPVHSVFHCLSNKGQSCSSVLEVGWFFPTLEANSRLFTAPNLSAATRYGFMEFEVLNSTVPLVLHQPLSFSFAPVALQTRLCVADRPIQEGSGETASLRDNPMMQCKELAPSEASREK